jgi:hypothetical protein
MTGLERLRGIPPVRSTRDPRRAVRWRREQLMAAGLDELAAQRLATRSDVDLHEVLSRGVLPGPVLDREGG